MSGARKETLTLTASANSAAAQNNARGSKRKSSALGDARTAVAHEPSLPALNGSNTADFVEVKKSAPQSQSAKPLLSVKSVHLQTTSHKAAASGDLTTPPATVTGDENSHPNHSQQHASEPAKRVRKRFEPARFVSTARSHPLLSFSSRKRRPQQLPRHPIHYPQQQRMDQL